MYGVIHPTTDCMMIRTEVTPESLTFAQEYQSFL